jgi:hypothetical protein
MREGIDADPSLRQPQIGAAMPEARLQDPQPGQGRLFGEHHHGAIGTRGSAMGRSCYRNKAGYIGFRGIIRHENAGNLEERVQNTRADRPLYSYNVLLSNQK